MATRFDFNIEVSGLASFIDMLQALPAEIKIAQVEAANKAGEEEKARLVDVITSQTSMKKQMAKSRLFLKRASLNESNPSLSLSGTTAAIPLRRGFKIRRRKTKYGTGVFADIEMNEPGKVLPATFYVEGKRTIFQRAKRGTGFVPRMPIVKAEVKRGMAGYFRGLVDESTRRVNVNYRKYFTVALNHAVQTRDSR